MAFLIDTSILVRLANRADSFFPVADQSLVELRRRGETVHITAQNLIEFRSVATRPKAVNGLGMPIPDVEAKAAEFEAVFPLIEETPDILPAWKALVGAAGVMGKQVHDARLVAVCQVHRVTHLLTFNIAHFARLAALVPGLVIVDPANV
jgi:predicted nucleic acid-binding protein